MAVFAQLTDLHLRPPGTLTLGRIDTDRFVVQAIDAINSRHPYIDAVIVSGDITDLGEEDAYNRAAMLLSRFAVPVIVIPGNHDSTPTLRDAFQAFPGFAEECVPGKACHVHKIGGVTVVALDTSVSSPDQSQHQGELGEAQLRWLDATLATSGPVLIAMHHPPFQVGIDFMDKIGLTDARAFAKVLARHENIVRIVCGHVHRTIVSEVGGVPVMAIPGVAHQVVLALDEMTPPALVMEPPAYGVHMIEGGRAVSHIGYVETYGAPVTFDDHEPVTA
ncbi:phosphodiesterase [Acuticoccus sediminis]|uniref:Phosphodiesterase n=1 Tax=Acuticoccus sediminis TaxID=2184697 RepID=A0A8B2NJA8_9HYPH|nr:phosphodiesterase [Acuticoccus sediminis]RAH99724.1 phosphodiesterase [Acuticoccus sediminis]